MPAGDAWRAPNAIRDEASPKSGEALNITEIREKARRVKSRRDQVRRLRAELEAYRTPAERAELEAILARHETTVAELLRTAA